MDASLHCILSGTEPKDEPGFVVDERCENFSDGTPSVAEDDKDFHRPPDFGRTTQRDQPRILILNMELLEGAAILGSSLDATSFYPMSIDECEKSLMSIELQMTSGRGDATASETIHKDSSQNSATATEENSEATNEDGDFVSDAPVFSESDVEPQMLSNKKLRFLPWTLEVTRECQHGVALIGHWGRVLGSIVIMGSGFLVDSSLGLVVTAAHVLYDLVNEASYGQAPKPHASEDHILIGFIPSFPTKETNAVFQFVATVKVHGILDGVDACVLQITHRFSAVRSSQQISEILLQPIEEIGGVSAQPLKMTTQYEVGENVMVAGYNQDEEWILRMGRHMCRCLDIVPGTVVRDWDKRFCTPIEVVSNGGHFHRERRLIVMCGGETIIGQSGGPALDANGHVIGILSKGRNDRAYIVPAFQIDNMVRKVQRSLLMGKPRAWTM